MGCVDNLLSELRSRVSARWTSRDEMVKSGVGHDIKKIGSTSRELDGTLLSTV